MKSVPPASSEEGPRGVSRRDFLAAATTFAAASALGLPKIALAADDGLQLAPDGAEIARLAIFPPIGFSRVGNSEKHFLAPEIPGLPSNPEGGFKDGDLKVKKQAQRFRIYAFDRRGRVIGEITSKTAEIAWTVHVANTKAAWYGFNNPLDAGPSVPGLPGQRRNQFIKADDREKLLAIDPGPVSISSRDAGRRPMVGKFWDKLDVKLGELLCDEHGRLIVLPGDGVSESALPDNPISNFSDNDGWQDDWCDGPVGATVTFEDGRRMVADEAWVACCGPNFAPEIPPFVTLYDVVENVMRKKKAPGVAPLKKPLSFRRDIYPFFRRLGLMEWVAAAANLREGWIKVGDFLDEAYIRRLADPSRAARDLRAHVFGQFRDPNSQDVQQYKMPYMLGDGVNYDFSPARWFLMPEAQYEVLKLWRDGDFKNDFDDPSIDRIQNFDDIPLTQQPAALTRAALEPCSGGAFHPGVELTWPMRQPALYRDDDAFRIARGDRPSLVQDIGPLLTPQLAFQGGNGAPPPIGPQMPGDLTRWMGLPWQCDAFSCQQVLYGNDFPNAVWWPALLPIDVLPEAYYRQVLRADLSSDQRIKFFESRAPWIRGVAGIGYHAEASYTDGLSEAISAWSRLGFVVKMPGPTDKGAPKRIPKEMFVEMDRGSMDLQVDEQPNLGL